MITPNIKDRPEYKQGFEDGKKEALQWRPIEEAPKDGSEFLAIDQFINNKDRKIWNIYSIAKWDKDVGFFRPSDEFCKLSFTAWQPLPSPPEQAE